MGGGFEGVDFMLGAGLLGAGINPGGGAKVEGLGAGTKPTTVGRDVALE